MKLYLFMWIKVEQTHEKFLNSLWEKSIMNVWLLAYGLSCHLPFPPFLLFSSCFRSDIIFSSQRIQIAAI